MAGYTLEDRERFELYMNMADEVEKLESPKLNWIDVAKKDTDSWAGQPTYTDFKKRNDIIEQSRNAVKEFVATSPYAPNDAYGQAQMAYVIAATNPGMDIKDAFKVAEGGLIQKELGLKYEKTGGGQAAWDTFLNGYWNARAGEAFGAYMLDPSNTDKLALAEKYYDKALSHKTAEKGYSWFTDNVLMPYARVSGVSAPGSVGATALMIGGKIISAATGYEWILGLAKGAAALYSGARAGMSQAGMDFYAMYREADANGMKLDMTDPYSRSMFVADAMIMGVVEVGDFFWSPTYRMLSEILTPARLGNAFAKSFWSGLRYAGGKFVLSDISESLEELIQGAAGDAIKNAVYEWSNENNGTEFPIKDWQDIVIDASSAFAQTTVEMLPTVALNMALTLGIGGARASSAMKNQSFTFDPKKKQGVLNTKYVAGSQKLRNEAQAEMKAEKEKETEGAESTEKVPGIRVVQTQNGAVPATEEDAKNLKELFKRNGGKEDFDIIIEGADVEDMKAEDRQSMLNMMGAVVNDYQDSGLVVGYADGALVVENKEDIEQVKDKLQKEGLQRSVEGDSIVTPIFNGAASKVDIITRAEAEARKAEIQPVSTWQFQNMIRQTPSRMSSQEFLRQEEVQYAFKTLVQQVTGMTAEEVEEAFNNDVDSISMRLPAGTTWENLSASAMFMPIMSQITGRTTDDLLSEGSINIDVTGKMQYVDRESNRAMEYDEKTGKVRLTDENGNVTAEYDANDTKHVASAYASMEKTGKNGFTVHVNKNARVNDIVHELMHITRRLASPERLVGFVKAYGNEDLWLEDIKDNGDGTYAFNGQTYSAYADAENAARVNEEKFVEDFMQYLRDGSAPNAEIASFFGQLKDFFRRFVEQFRDNLSADTVRAFDMLLNGEVDIQPGQTIEQAVKDSERTLTDDAEDEFEQTATDYVDDENMYDEEGNPLYSLGRGYDWSRGMSVNAVYAYESGEMPISKWTNAAIDGAIDEADVNSEVAELLKQLPLDVKRLQLLENTSWHHTSKFYNKIDFFSLKDLSEVTVEQAQGIVEASKKYKKALKDFNAKVKELSEKYTVEKNYAGNGYEISETKDLVGDVEIPQKMAAFMKEINSGYDYSMSGKVYKYGEKPTSKEVKEGTRRLNAADGVVRFEQYKDGEYRTVESIKTDASIQDLIKKANNRYNGSKVIKDVIIRPSFYSFFNDYSSTLYSLSPEAQRQYDEVVAKYKGTDQWLKAPNGKPTNLTERQWVMVRTPNFIRWFGDWINDPANASKVIDENGEPKIVYHGTPYYGFTTFHTKNAGWFSESKSFALGYAEERSWPVIDTGDEDLVNIGVYEVFLNIRNPIDLSEYDSREEVDGEELAEILNKATNSDDFDSDIMRKPLLGKDPIYESWNYDLSKYHKASEHAVQNGRKAYDGIIIGEDSFEEGFMTYGVFFANQVKSATDNNGEFSSGNDSTLYSLAENRQWQIMDANTQRRIDADYEFTRNQYFGTDKWMKAPNGQPTKLTERQWVMVRTPAFEAWFGDWENDPENSSRVVDENGEPKIVYHGTNMAGFETFQSGEFGVFFTDDIDVAKSYVYENRENPNPDRSFVRFDMTSDAEDERLLSGSIYAVFLNMRDPVTYDAKGNPWYDIMGKGVEGVSPDMNDNEESVAAYAAEYSYDENPDNDGTIVQNVRDYGSGDDATVVKPSTVYVIPWGAENQIKSVDNVGTFSGESENVLYSLTPAQETRALQELDSFPEDERNRIADNFKRLAGTPWHREAMKALVIRSEMRTLMEGHNLPKDSVLRNAEDKNRLKAHIKALKGGIEGIFSYLEKMSFISNPEKCVHAVNSSLLNCNPSLECAKFCYASEGNYVYWQNILKSEMISHAVESDPVRAAKIIARQYKATTDYMVGKALRLFDKGDFSEQYVTLVKELNKEDIAVQVFSKRPEFLKQIDNGINVAMLSIDRSNRFLADENPEMAIAMVYTGRMDINFIEANAKRYEDRGGVILPVKLGTRILSQEELKALPQWARTKYTCPIDAGVKKLGEWNCQKCDINGTGGCFYKNTAENRKHRIYASISDMDVEAIDEATKEIQAILEKLGISPDSGEFRRIVENLHLHKSDKLEGIDPASEETGVRGNGEDSSSRDRDGELAVEENNRIVDEFKKEFPDADIAELDGVKYIKDENATYTDDELRSIKDSVSQTLYSIQPELNFSGQLELDFSGNQGNTQQATSGETGLLRGGYSSAGAELRGLRPGVAQYFDWDKGWNGQEPSSFINDQWDNLGYISFIGAQPRNDADLAKLFSVYKNPKLEYFHLILTRNNEIVYHLAMSAGIPDMAFAVPEGGARRIMELMSAVGADGYYLMHNHPGKANMNASQKDKSLTAWYAKTIPGFKGHVILGNTSYGFFNEKQKYTINDLPGMHKVKGEYPIVSGTDDLSAYFLKYAETKKAPVTIFYADSNNNLYEVEDLNELPTRKHIHDKLKNTFNTRAWGMTTDWDLYNEMMKLVSNANPLYNLVNFYYIDPLVVDHSQNRYMTSHFYRRIFTPDVWGPVSASITRRGERGATKWEKTTDAGTLYSLSPERQSEILQARKAEIQRAVEAGIFVSTEYLEEFRGEDWVESELDFRDWMKENADIVTMAREADSFEQFKTRYEKKDESEEDADIPFSAEGLFDTEEEQEKYEDWLRKIYHYANALSLQDRDRRFAEEWTSSEDKTLELAKYLRSYMDAAWNPKPKSRSGGYWYTKNVYNSFKGVSQKVRMLNDGKGRGVRNMLKQRSSSEEIKEAQELIRQNPRPYRNAYMQAMLGESRASDVQMGLRNIGESADWMKLDMIDDDIAQEIEKIESEETAKKASGVDYKTDSQTLVQKRNDAETDLKKSGESTSSTAKDLKDKLASAEQRIRELEADIKNAESEVDEIIGRMGERIEDLEEKAGKNAALKRQLADRRARVKKLKRELSAANKEKTRLNNALNALRRWKEAKEEMDYRKKRIRQIRRLATFNDATLDAMFEDTFDWVAALFDRDEADMDRRKDLDQRISDLKHEIERAETGGEDASPMREALRRLQNQKKQSRILEPPAQLQRYLPRNYSVRADNRPSLWTSQELDTLLKAVQLMRMDAKAILQDKKNQRMATLMGTAYSYFQQSLGYEAPYDDYGEMSARALGEEVANLPDKTFGTAKEKYLSYHLYKLKIQRLARIIDGYKEGVAYNWFVRRNWKCQTEELKGTNERLDLGEGKWKELELRRGDLSKEGFKGTKLNGTEYSLTRGQMIGVYVYAQSDLGYEKLTSVYGNAIRKEDVEAITSQLSDKEKAWADFMLEEMQNNYPRLSKVYYNVWNRNLGQRPAYFPLVSSEARTVDQKDADFLCAQVNGKDGKAYVDKGFTKDVNPNAIYPLKLDVTATWNQQVRRQEHFIAYGEWSRDTQYLMDRGQMGDTIAKAYGPQYRKTLQKMVDHVISNTITTGTDFDRTITKYFSARNAAALTASVSTALKQLGSIGAIFENEGDIGKLLANENYLRNFLKANAELNAEYGDVKDVREFIYANAPDIRNRQIDFEVMAYLNRVYGGAVSNTIQQATGKIMKYTTNLMDRLVVERLWLARYYTEFEAQKEAGKTVRQAHEEAVFKASQLISETQPTSMRMDQSAQQIEAQKSSLLRMVSVFTNQAMNLSNMIMADWNYARKNRDWKKVVRVTSAVLINTVSVALISGRFIKKGDEDDEKYRWRLAREILGTVAQLADPVWGGNLLQGLTSAFGGSNYLNEFTDLGSVIRVLTTPTDRKTAWEKIADALEDIAGEALNVMGIPGSNLLRKPVKAIQEKNAGYLLNSAWGQIIESYR